MNLRAFFALMLLSGLAALLLSYFLPKRRKYISMPVVISTMMIFALSFMPMTMDWFLGGLGSPDYGSVRNVLIGSAVLAFTLFLNQYGRGVLKYGAIALGILFGLTISLPFGLARWPVSGLENLQVPKLLPYEPAFDLATFYLIFPILIVLLVKQLMDLFVYATQAGLSEEDEAALLKKGMKTNAVGYGLAFLLGSVPTSAQIQNLGMNVFLQRHSRTGIALAGAVLVLAGFLPKLTSALTFLPLPVLGAVGLIMITALMNQTLASARRVKWHQKQMMVLSLSFLFGLMALFRPEAGIGLSHGFKVILQSGICVTFFSGLFLELVIPEN